MRSTFSEKVCALLLKQNDTNVTLNVEKCKDYILRKSFAKLWDAHEEMFVFLRLTNLSTKATNSSHSVPSVRCLPDIAIGSRLCVLVTHIPCVCMSTFPKARHPRSWWKSFSPTLYIYKDNSVSPHVSNALNLHMAGCWMRAVHLIARTGLSEGEVAWQNTCNESKKLQKSSVPVTIHSCGGFLKGYVDIQTTAYGGFSTQT